MNSTLQAQILDVEEQLRTAMLGSDVATLSELLAPDLIFANHLGQLTGKEDDIAAYRSGVLKVMNLEPSEQQIRALGDVAVVSVRMQVRNVCGESCEWRFPFHASVGTFTTGEMADCSCPCGSDTVAA
jgi:hypothetical protein